MGQSGAKPNKVNVKASCQMAISRMNIHKGKKQNEILKKKQEIANLLKNGNEDLAKIKVESVIREENTIIAYDIISQMVDVCSERTDFLIDLKREIPTDMWPHLQTIYYAGPRLDIPELNQFCSLMQKRCQGLGNQLVNVTVKEKLELCLYEEEIKVMKLKEIASQYKVEYVPKSDPFKALREDPLPPPSVPQMQPQFQPQNQGNIVISTGNQGEIQIQLQPNSFQQPMQGYPQPYQFGMQPQFQPGMQPTIQAGMQAPMQQGLQPSLQPGMQPQSQPGMFQQGNQYPQIPQVPQNDLNQQQNQQNFGDIPSVPTGFQQPNFQQGKNAGPPGQPPNPF